MKSYTDLEQSKKLAEILPMESADMAWCNNSIRGVNYTDEYSANLYTVKEMQECFDETLNGWDKYWELIPCWSLAALLDVLPKNLNIGRPSLESNYKEYYWIQYYDEFMKPNNYKTECFNNPIDACVTMIEKLYELKML